MSSLFFYLGGFFTAFDFVDTGLSESDPVSDTLQLPAVLFHTLRHSGENVRKCQGRNRHM